MPILSRCMVYSIPYPALPCCYGYYHRKHLRLPLTMVTETHEVCGAVCATPSTAVGAGLPCAPPHFADRCWSSAARLGPGEGEGRGSWSQVRRPRLTEGGRCRAAGVCLHHHRQRPITSFTCYVAGYGMRSFSLSLFLPSPPASSFSVIQHKSKEKNI